MHIHLQVVYGGRLDIDASIKDPRGRVVWEQHKVQTESHTFTATVPGAYEFCFSNKMSTVAHKTVYIDIEVGEEEAPLEEMRDHHTALTQMETMCLEMHESLKKVQSMQTHHRLREATHRHTAEYMNSRVQLVSAGEALLLIVISVVQILYLRGLFSERPNRF